MSDGRNRSLIDYMLGKLENQMQQAVQLQKSGNFSEALSCYGLIFEALIFYEELGYRDESASIQKLALETQTTPAVVLYFHALILFHRKRYESALESAKSALTLTPHTIIHLLIGKILTAMGELTSAYDIFNLIQELEPESGGVDDSLFLLAAEKEMPGGDYYDWLQQFHTWLNPAVYVEIGLGHGRSLALSGLTTNAIGIDPYQGFWERLNYACPHGPAKLFPLTSDDFFEKHDLPGVMGHATFDLGFIDGLHLFEQVLKDFINLERYARKDSIILIHDCLPIAPIVAKRDRCTGFWTGDVWRIIPCLKTFRPDLNVMTIPTKPSGLGVVGNLDAASTVLADNYDDIIRYYLSLNCPENFEQRKIVCNVGSADKDSVRDRFIGREA